MPDNPTTVTVELDAAQLEALQAIAERVEWLDGPADVLATLADHVEQGLRRPGSWERPWLTSVFPELARVAGVVLTMDTIVRDLAARDARRATTTPDPYLSPPEDREHEGGARERSETTRSEPRSRCGRGFCYCAARQRWEDAVRGGRTDDR